MPYAQQHARLTGGNVVGLGMNAYELGQNKQLSSYVTKDLNVEPTFPFEDGSFDRVTCVVSVDYLNKPKEVFAEIGRVLRPGGTAMVSISNRWWVMINWSVRWLGILVVVRLAAHYNWSIVYFILIYVPPTNTSWRHILFFSFFCLFIRLEDSFPTKAFQIWLQTSDLEHVFIVGSFFHYTRLFDAPSCDDISPYPGRSDPLFIVKATKK